MRLFAADENRRNTFYAGQERMNNQNQQNNNRLEVLPTRFQDFLLVGLLIFWLPLNSFAFYSAITDQYSSAKGRIIKGAVFLLAFGLMFLITFLIIRAKRKSVKFFDANGITRCDGKHFAWSDFQGVATKTARKRFGGFYVWRRELLFKNGETAWLIPQRIKNYAEVFAYVEKLPSAQLKTNI